MKIEILGYNSTDQILYKDKKSLMYLNKVFLMEDVSLIVFKLDSKLSHHPRMVELDAEINHLDHIKYPSILDHYSDYYDQNIIHHLIYERDRIQKFIDDYKNQDIKSCGQLMYQSYDSYKYFVGQTTQEQDFLIFLSKSMDILGANISKNHLICLIRDEDSDQVIHDLMNHYHKKYKKELMII